MGADDNEHAPLDDLMSSDRRTMLIANRLIVANNLLMAGPREATPLSRQLEAIAEKLEALDAAESEDDIGRAIHTPDAPFDPDSL